MLSKIFALKTIGLFLQILNSLGMEDNFNKDIADISKICINNYSESIHLTYESKETDAKIFVLRGPASLRRTCGIHITGPKNKLCSDKKCMIVVVMEFINRNLSTTACKSIVGTITYTSKDNLLSNVCSDINSNSNMRNNAGQQTHTSIINRREFSINLNFTNLLGTIEITIASAKYLGDHKYCSRNSETKCVLKKQTLCIKKLLICNGNVNCENSESYNEHCRNKMNYKNKIGAILYGFFLIVVFLYFLIQLLRTCSPNVSDNFFVFNEDEDSKLVPASQSLPPLHLEEEAEITRHNLTTNKRY